METIPQGTLTVHEAAVLTGFTRQWIYDLIAEKKIKSFKRQIGRIAFYLIDRSSLEEYCASPRRGSNGDKR